MRKYVLYTQKKFFFILKYVNSAVIIYINAQKIMLITYYFRINTGCRGKIHIILITFGGSYGK